MTEFMNGGGGDREKEDDGAIGRMGKWVARREKRRAQDEGRYAKLRARVANPKPTITEADIRARERDLNELLVLEERLGTSGVDPYKAAAEEESYNPDSAVPEWLRKKWENDRAKAGGAVVDIMMSQAPETSDTSSHSALPPIPQEAA